MDTGNDDVRTDAEVSSAAGWVTVLALAVTTYLAIWQIDWDGSVLAPIGFVIVTSGLIGSATEWMLRRTRG